MHLKTTKRQAQSEQLQNKELEWIAGGRLNELVKKLSLRSKVTRWAAAVAFVVGVPVSMVMPAVSLNRTSFLDCLRDDLHFRVFQEDDKFPTMCFVNAGDEKVVIANVRKITAGNNAGYIETNKIKITFEKNTVYNFIESGQGTVTITRIVIY